MLGQLRRAEFTDAQALSAYRSVNTFLLGFLLLETSADPDTPVHDVDPHEFPNVHELRDGLATTRFDTEFARGLSAVLNSIASVRSEAPPD